MKRIVPLIVVFVLSLSAHGQSKEETINWLNTNAGTLLTVNNKIGKEDHVRRFIEVRNDTLRLYARHDCDCGTWSTHEYEYYLPVRSILYQDVNSLPMDEKNDFTWFNVHLVPKTTIRYTRDREWDKEEQSIYEFYYKRADVDNAKRVLKAIMHLAKLSGAKENKQVF